MVVNKKGMRRREFDELPDPAELVKDLNGKMLRGERFFSDSPVEIPHGENLQQQRNFYIDLFLSHYFPETPTQPRGELSKQLADDFDPVLEIVTNTLWRLGRERDAGMLRGITLDGMAGRARFHHDIWGRELGRATFLQNTDEVRRKANYWFTVERIVAGAAAIQRQG